MSDTISPVTDCAETWTYDNRLFFSAKKSGSFLRRIRGKREGQPKVEDDDWSVNMSDVLGVSMKRRYNANRQIGVCMGVSVYTYRVNKRLQLEARERVLEHPSEELCLFWISRLQQLTDGEENFKLHLNSTHKLIKKILVRTK